MIVIYISLMTNDVKHLFLSSLVICISSIDKCLVKYLAHFLIGLSFCCCSRPLPEILFANIFSHSIGCHYIFVIVSYDTKKFLIMRPILFLFAIYVFIVTSKNQLPSLRIWRFILMFSSTGFTIVAFIFYP